MLDGEIIQVEYKKLETLPSLNEESPWNGKILGNSMKRIIQNSQNTIKRVAMSTPSFIGYLESLNPQEVFDVNMPGDIRKLYEQGKLTLKMRKDGSGLVPVLFNQNGNIVKQVTLTRKEIAPDLANKLNDMAVQQQLGEIIDKLEEMNSHLIQVLQGQQNDRIALYYSAQQQYLEALEVESPDLKRLALTNAIKTANDARFQLMETAKCDIKEILDCNHPSSQKYADTVESIRIAFKFINDSTGICAAAYAELGEKQALLRSLQPYKIFIDQYLLTPDAKGNYAYKELQEWDKKSDNMWLDLPKKTSDQLAKFTINIPIHYIDEIRDDSIKQLVLEEEEEDKYNVTNEYIKLFHGM